MTVKRASRRVMEKAGLRHVRSFFEEWPAYIDDAGHGDVEYALDRTEYEQQTSSAPPTSLP